MKRSRLIGRRALPYARRWFKLGSGISTKRNIRRLGMPTRENFTITPSSIDLRARAFSKRLGGQDRNFRDSVAGKNRQRNFQCPRVFRAQKHAKGQKQLEHRRESHGLGTSRREGHCDCCQQGLGRAVALQLTAEGVELAICVRNVEIFLASDRASYLTGLASRSMGARLGLIDIWTRV
jgi:hypothetical protein